MRRPNTHFVNRNREGGQLRASASLKQFVCQKPDIDNLLKFVLDALTGSPYHDDSQVAHTVCSKVWDNAPPFNGRTVFEMTESMGTDISFPSWAM